MRMFPTQLFVFVESIECLSGIIFRYFIAFLVAITGAPVPDGATKHVVL